MEKHVEALMKLSDLNEQKTNALIQLSIMLSAIAERMGAWALDVQDQNLKTEILNFRSQILHVLQPKTHKEEHANASTINPN